MERVYTNKAPEAVGPYSQAVISGRYVFTSGQLGIGQDGKLGASIKEQTENAIKNTEAVLLSVGLGLDAVVKTTCYLADIKDFAVFNETYAKYFTNKPARSLIEAAALPKGSLIEIDVVAETENKV